MRGRNAFALLPGTRGNNFVASSATSKGARLSRRRVGKSCHYTVILPLYGRTPTKDHGCRRPLSARLLRAYAEIPLPTISEKKGRVMADDQEVLTVKEVCELLRVHPSTVYKLVRQGKLPSFRVGNEWRFRKDAIMPWMAEKSMHARQVRAAVDSRVNGEGQHRQMVGSRGPRR